MSIVQDSGPDTAVPSQPPGTGQASDGGGTSSAAMGGHKRRVQLLLPQEEGGLLYQERLLEQAQRQPPPGMLGFLNRYGEHDAPPHQTSGQFPRKHASARTPGAMIIAPHNSVLPSDKGQMGQPSPLPLPEWTTKPRKMEPVAFCCFLCCILFLLLVVSMSVVVLVVYLLHHPQPPQLRVTTATLNSGYIDRLPPPRGGFNLNSDLRVLATIYNPNTRIDVVLRYMQVDLYFQGAMIGSTQAALRPPIHEHPGGSANRTVRLVVTNVRIPQADAEVWHNATTIRGRLLELQLFAMIHTQLNFGRRLHFRYWVFTRCTLWLGPPPRGALHRAQCGK